MIDAGLFQNERVELICGVIVAVAGLFDAGA